jgi:hypothetical protein
VRGPVEGLEQSTAGDALLGSSAKAAWSKEACPITVLDVWVSVLDMVRPGE